MELAKKVNGQSDDIYALQLLFKELKMETIKSDKIPGEVRSNQIYSTNETKAVMPASSMSETERHHCRIAGHYITSERFEKIEESILGKKVVDTGRIVFCTKCGQTLAEIRGNK